MMECFLLTANQKQVYESLSDLFGGELSSENDFHKLQKITEISASSENCFFGNQAQVISNGH